MTVSFVRRVEIRVSFELIVHLLTKGTEIHARMSEALPTGARLVRVDTKDTAEAVLVFEHESFAPVSPGDRLPVIMPKVERVDCAPRIEERTAIRVTPKCSACAAPAYIGSLDFLSYPCTETDLWTYIPAGRPRYGCPEHPPRKEVVVQCDSKREAEDLLARPLALAARIVEAAHLGARG